MWIFYKPGVVSPRRPSSLWLEFKWTLCNNWFGRGHAYNIRKKPKVLQTLCNVMVRILLILIALSWFWCSLHTWRYSVAVVWMQTKPNRVWLCLDVNVMWCILIYKKGLGFYAHRIRFLSLFVIHGFIIWFRYCLICYVYYLMSYVILFNGYA